MKGSHNTLTFAPPYHKWANVFRFIWKCQNKNIIEQINEGVRMFDLHIAFDMRKLKFVGVHRTVKLDCDPDIVLALINKKCPGAYVRVILEHDNPSKYSQDIRIMFKNFCNKAKHEYTNLVLFGGYINATNAQIYRGFNTPAYLDYLVYEHTGAKKSLYGKIFPWLWAKLNKKDTPEWACSTDDQIMVLLDFV